VLVLNMVCASTHVVPAKKILRVKDYQRINALQDLHEQSAGPMPITDLGVCQDQRCVIYRTSARFCPFSQRELGNEFGGPYFPERFGSSASEKQIRRRTGGLCHCHFTRRPGQAVEWPDLTRRGIIDYKRSHPFHNVKIGAHILLGRSLASLLFPK